MGARAAQMAEGGRLPVTHRGRARSDPDRLPHAGPSAQIKSAVLLAALAAPGETTVIESEASRDHTEKLLAHFGAEVTVTPDGAHGRKIVLKGEPELVPRRSWCRPIRRRPRFRWWRR